MDCTRCGFDPCECQRALMVADQKRDVPQRYDFRECTTPGCTVVIGFLAGATRGLTTCKWCNAGVAHAK